MWLITSPGMWAGLQSVNQQPAFWLYITVTQTMFLMMWKTSLSKSSTKLKCMGIYWQQKIFILYISILGGKTSAYLSILEYMHGPSMIYTAIKTKTHYIILLIKKWQFLISYKQYIILFIFCVFCIFCIFWKKMIFLFSSKNI